MLTTARDLTIDAFSYNLPDERIARYPLADRAAAKQLVYNPGGNIKTEVFATLPERLPAGCLLVGNRTRVIHARLYFPLGEGKRPVEVFCLDPLDPVDYALSLGARTRVGWKVLIGGNRRWKRGDLSLAVPVDGRDVRLSVRREERLDNAFAVTFDWSVGDGDPAPTFGEVLAAAGTIPLPPYLGRAAEADDHERYQTVFARAEGSVAAPTAGLHFTPAVLAGLAERGHRWAEVTLHVGAGTFKPVDAPTLGGHVMHREFFSVDRALIRRLLDQRLARRPLVSVGTTSLRCLESLFYLGASLLAGRPLDAGSPAEVGQWVAEDPALVDRDPNEALRALLDWLEDEGIDQLVGYTRLLLSPAARLRLADGLITNFHQPRSTLLLLIAAVVGPDWRRIYDYALANDYRFLSYGDSSLLWNKR